MRKDKKERREGMLADPAKEQASIPSAETIEASANLLYHEAGFRQAGLSRTGISEGRLIRDMVELIIRCAEDRDRARFERAKIALASIEDPEANVPWFVELMDDLYTLVEVLTPTVADTYREHIINAFTSPRSRPELESRKGAVQNDEK